MYETLQQQQEELQSKFKEQAKLVQEASEALKAVEAESSMKQQELVALQSQREADIQQAVGQAVFDYQEQLSLAQNDLQQKDREHQQSIQRLQDQVRALELSLAGQVTLPSVAASSSKTGLLPGSIECTSGYSQSKTRSCSVREPRPGLLVSQAGQIRGQ